MDKTSWTYKSGPEVVNGGIRTENVELDTALCHTSLLGHSKQELQSESMKLIYKISDRKYFLALFTVQHYKKVLFYEKLYSSYNNNC